MPESVIKHRRSNVPTGREVMIEDIANAVVFLAGEHSRSITGTVLTVDAGATAQLLPRRDQV